MQIMSKRFQPRFFVLLAAVLVTACADRGSFPSLAPRPYEKPDQQPAPSSPSPVAARPSDAGLLRRINTSVQKVSEGTRAFNDALSGARAALSRFDGRKGSESWIAAQMAISNAERYREPAQAALTELDMAKREMLLAGPSVDEAALNLALSRVTEINNAQADAVANLLRAIGSR